MGCDVGAAVGTAEGLVEGSSEGDVLGGSVVIQYGQPSQKQSWVCLLNAMF